VRAGGRGDEEGRAREPSCAATTTRGGLAGGRCVGLATHTRVTQRVEGEHGSGGGRRRRTAGSGLTLARPCPRHTLSYEPALAAAAVQLLSSCNPHGSRLLPLPLLVLLLPLLLVPPSSTVAPPQPLADYRHFIDVDPDHRLRTRERAAPQQAVDARAPPSATSSSTSRLTRTSRLGETSPTSSSSTAYAFSTSSLPCATSTSCRGSSKPSSSWPTLSPGCATTAIWPFRLAAARSDRLRAVLPLAGGLSRLVTALFARFESVRDGSARLSSTTTTSPHDSSPALAPTLSYITSLGRRSARQRGLGEERCRST